MNSLTTKEYWSEGWKKIKLPARFFFNDYSHLIISGLIDKFINKKHTNFLEIGGCPGRWADYFNTKHSMVCDSMDYDENNVKLTKENYKLLGIKGDVFLGDITNSEFEPRKKYNIVLSNGLVEHFVDSSEVFRNHVKFLKSRGLLIIGVPNIKKSWFYDFLAKFDKIGYAGYRHVDKSELLKYAKDNKLEVYFCNYIGVFNLGLINFNVSNSFIYKLFIAVHLIFSFITKTLKIKKESLIFSPYIFLIAKKYE